MALISLIKNKSAIKFNLHRKHIKRSSCWLWRKCCVAPLRRGGDISNDSKNKIERRKKFHALARLWSFGWHSQRRNHSHRSTPSDVGRPGMPLMCWQIIFQCKFTIRNGCVRQPLSKPSSCTRNCKGGEQSVFECVCRCLNVLHNSFKNIKSKLSEYIATKWIFPTPPMVLGFEFSLFGYIVTQRSPARIVYDFYFGDLFII